MLFADSNLRIHVLSRFKTLRFVGFIFSGKLFLTVSAALYTHYNAYTHIFAEGPKFLPFVT